MEEFDKKRQTHIQVKRAYCCSGYCRGEKRYKDVPAGTVFCPECTHALFWEIRWEPKDKLKIKPKKAKGSPYAPRPFKEKDSRDSE